jgi:ferredoxin
MDYIFFENDRMIYVPMDKVVEINHDLGQPDQSFLPSSLVEHFIECAEHHWVMDQCICRSASHCENYPVGLGCLFLGEASAHIDPRLGREVTKQEALEHLRRCRDAGLVHVIGRNKLDSAWLGVKPDNKLMTICNCCPCCCLWKMLPDLSPVIGSKVIKMPGVNVKVSGECTGCGTCIRSCFLGAIRLVEGHAAIGDDCRGCGRCASVCPQKAIAVTLDDRIKETIGLVSASVDLS